ncbi:response regulator [Bacillus sp. HNG]|uniref:response regulator n=1 Tax=Bacillus sp. HNG TaxID=2293325 RepID=UPI000E2E8E52|nr:response regulator [Bacillus sp. HNG]RFB17436.1 response regulator [Bacillus sp. HNG]
MIKVVIADDEEKVCQLIIGLIDWEALDMQIVGIAHNGIEALDKIKECDPDLIITDIRMPGYDGLEMIRFAQEIKTDLDFIIISGYRHFQYAQNAIKYGVGDYLLKPINKEDFMVALEKMKNRYRKRTEQYDNVERLKMQLKNESFKLRNNLFNELLLDKTHGYKNITIESINENYQFSFQPGTFQIFIVKIDCNYNEQLNHAIDILQEKATQIISSLLKGHCNEMWTFRNGSFLYTIINYDSSIKSTIRNRLKSILDELIVQGTAFEQFTFTVGVGSAFEEINQMWLTFEEARYSIMERLVIGTQRLIEETPHTREPQRVNELLVELNKPMEAAIEVLDKEGVLQCIANLKTHTSQIDEINGDTIYSIIEQAWNLYLLHMRNNQFISSFDELNKTFKENVSYCSSVDELFTFMSNLMGEFLDIVIEDEKQKETKPIRIAKQYIQQNYMHQISLEEISHIVGFNSAYFSTLFKKISGSNFVDYCVQIRMNKAKELLRETNLSIAVICEQVGYNDLKHFTKTFKKKIGLKPNEFRKLYS